MKEINSTAASTATILEHLQSELIKAIDDGKTNFRIDLDLKLEDPNMASFYIWEAPGL